MIVDLLHCVEFLHELQIILESDLMNVQQQFNPLKLLQLFESLLSNRRLADIIEGQKQWELLLLARLALK